MEITKVKFYDMGTHNNPKFLACCSVVLDNCLMLNDIKVLSGNKGRYIIMPEKSKCNRKDKADSNNSSEDVFHPVKQSYFAYMTEVILKGYEVCSENGSFVYFPK